MIIRFSPHRWLAHYWFQFLSYYLLRTMALTSAGNHARMKNVPGLFRVWLKGLLNVFLSSISIKRSKWLFQWVTQNMTPTIPFLEFFEIVGNTDLSVWTMIGKLALRISINLSVVLSRLFFSSSNQLHVQFPNTESIGYKCRKFAVTSRRSAKCQRLKGRVKLPLLICISLIIVHLTTTILQGIFLVS